MATFTMQDFNHLPTTPEEDEAMDALSRLGAGIPFVAPKVDLGLRNAFADKLDAPEPQPTLESIMANIMGQLQLLTTVISQSKAQPEGANLKDCVEQVLQQAVWFDSMVKEEIKETVEDKDMSYEIESAVETHFSNSFSLNDHVDMDSLIEDAVKDRLEDMLSDLVSEKLSNLRITFD